MKPVNEIRKMNKAAISLGIVSPEKALRPFMLDLARSLEAQSTPITFSQPELRLSAPGLTFQGVRRDISRLRGLKFNYLIVDTHTPRLSGDRNYASEILRQAPVFVDGKGVIVQGDLHAVLARVLARQFMDKK